MHLQFTNKRMCLEQDFFTLMEMSIIEEDSTLVLLLLLLLLLLML